MKSIVLVTDFGASSPYVAEMKGAILTICDSLRIVDGTHAVPPQDVAQGALILEQLVPAFPQDSIFVTVVDPGVGTGRDILLVQWRGRRLIAPDNGLLTHFFDDSEIRRVDRPEYWREDVSNTFHGRDIMGPIAAHLANGVADADVGSSAEFEPIRLNKSQPSNAARRVTGEVVFVDSFGNLISNIPASDVSRTDGITEFQQLRLKISHTYGDASDGSPLALLSSRGYLEVAVNGGNAAEQLNANVGDKICFRWD